MFRNHFGILIILLACSVLGCGKPYGTPVAVSGKISLGGKPVEKARIIFRANDKKLPGELSTVMTELKPDGTYSFDKVYPTEYVVILESTEGMDATKSAIPVESPLTPYGADSKLRANVTVEKTTFDFELSGSK